LVSKRIVGARLREGGGVVVEGDFCVGLGHSVEAIYRPYCAVETAHTQGHIQQQQ
jgi:hypothetical protein